MNRLRGTLLLSMDDHTASGGCYRRRSQSRDDKAPSSGSCAPLLDLARLWRDQGKRTEARDLLAPVYNWFTEGFDTPVLQEAKALLEQLSA